MNSMRKKVRSGAVLVLAVVMVVILLIIGLALTRLGLDARLQAVRSQLVIEAKTAADAGLSHLLAVLNADPFKYASGTLPPLQTDFEIPGSDLGRGQPATFSYTFDYDSGLFWDANSIGVAGQTQRIVKARLTIASVFSEGALITRRNCGLKNNIAIDGYNSSGDPKYDNVPVKVGSTSNVLLDGDPPVTIGNNCAIDGDVVCGVGGDPSKLISSGSAIDSQYALSEEIIFPPITIPEYLKAAAATALTVNGGTAPLDSGKYTNIELKQNGDTLTVTGNIEVYVTGNIDMKNSTKIIIDPGSSLIIYIDGDFYSQPNCSYNDPEDPNDIPIPANFRIYGTSPTEDQTIQLQPKGDLYAVIYAPNADVEFWPNGDWYGSCLVRSFTPKNNNNFIFYYDKALAQTVSELKDIFFRVDRWSEE